MNFEKFVHQIFLISYLCSHVCSQCHPSSSAAFSEWLPKQWWIFLNIYIYISNTKSVSLKTLETQCSEASVTSSKSDLSTPSRSVRPWPAIRNTRGCYTIILEGKNKPRWECELSPWLPLRTAVFWEWPNLVHNYQLTPVCPTFCTSSSLGQVHLPTCSYWGYTF